MSTLRVRGHDAECGVSTKCKLPGSYSSPSPLIRKFNFRGFHCTSSRLWFKLNFVHSGAKLKLNSLLPLTFWPLTPSLFSFTCWFQTFNLVLFFHSLKSDLQTFIVSETFQQPSSATEFLHTQTPNPLRSPTLPGKTFFCVTLCYVQTWRRSDHLSFPVIRRLLDRSPARSLADVARINNAPAGN